MAKLCLYKLSIDFWGTGDWPSNCLICVSDWPEWPGWLDLLSHSPKHQPSHHHSHIHSFTHRQMGSANMKCTVSWQLIIITSTLCLGELSLSFFFLHVTHFLNFWSITQALQIYPVTEPESAEWCVSQWEDPAECWNIRVYRKWLINDSNDL